MLNPIDEIKNRLDIVEVVGSYIKLQKAGVNYRAVCPFHSEKKPSFFVSPSRQIWHCFGGCGIGGDVFKFVMQIEGVEFGDALRLLAQRAGVELKKQSPEYAQFKTERHRLYEICELACKFFEKQLESSQAGREAGDYLLSRKISGDSIKKWRLGYSPDTWQGLSDFLAEKGYEKEEAEKAGLAIKNEEGGFYDRFRGRIIFPIFDLNSQPVGFGGRVFKTEDPAKYINSPGTLLYDKSRILYGLDKAKMDIRSQKSCILVEGYIDAIMASQAGSANVVATSGTALTFYQLKLLKRYTDNLILGFDMDFAGDTATKRGINLAQSQGFNIKVLRLAGGKDAAEIISNEPKDWEAALLDRKSILEFYFESAFKGRDPENPEAKKEISKLLLPVIKEMPNEIEKSFWIQKLAGDLKVKEDVVLAELKKAKPDENDYGYDYDPKQEKSSEVSPRSRGELLEEQLLTLVLKFPKTASLVSEEENGLLTSQSQEIISGLKKNHTSSADLFPQEVRDRFNYLALRAEIEDIEEKDSEREIKFCLKEIAGLEIKKKLDKISGEIKAAERENNFLRLQELSSQFNQLYKTLNNYS